MRLNHSRKHSLIIVTPLLLTGKDNKEDDGNINEEELEVSKVTEDLINKDKGTGSTDQLLP